MSTRAEGSYEIKSWDEKPLETMTGGKKTTRATVKKTFSGDIEGESTLEYLMAHGEEGAGSFVGIEVITGRIGERSGSFTLQHIGTFNSEGVAGEHSVVPGSGTGDLKGLRGEGTFSYGHMERYPMVLDYRFEG